jgi:hypothetical protein
MQHIHIHTLVDTSSDAKYMYMYIYIYICIMYMYMFLIPDRMPAKEGLSPSPDALMATYKTNNVYVCVCMYVCMYIRIMYLCIWPQSLARRLDWQPARCIMYMYVYVCMYICIYVYGICMCIC